METNINSDESKDDKYYSLIEEAVEGLREGTLNLDNIIQKYKGNALGKFVEELTNALAIEEIFREFSGRSRPCNNDNKPPEINIGA